MTRLSEESAIAVQALDRLIAAIEEEEEQHRQLAELVNRVLAQPEQALSNGAMNTFIELMQSFDHMRQRAGYLSEAVRIVLLAGDSVRVQLADLGQRSPSQRDSSWLSNLVGP